MINYNNTSASIIIYLVSGDNSTVLNIAPPSCPLAEVLNLAIPS